MAIDFFLKSASYQQGVRQKTLARRAIVFAELPDDFRPSTKISKKRAEAIRHSCLERGIQASSCQIRHDLDAYRVGLKFYWGTDQEKKSLTQRLGNKNDPAVGPLRYLVKDGLVTAGQAGLAGLIQDLVVANEPSQGEFCAIKPKLLSFRIEAEKSEAQLDSFSNLIETLENLPDKFLLVARSVADQLSLGAKMFFEELDELRQENNDLKSKVQSLESQMGDLYRALVKLAEWSRKDGKTSFKFLTSQYPELLPLLDKSQKGKKQEKCAAHKLLSEKLPSRGLCFGSTEVDFIYTPKFLGSFNHLQNYQREQVVRAVDHFSECGAGYQSLRSKKLDFLIEDMPEDIWVSHISKKWLMLWLPPGEERSVEFLRICHHVEVYSSEA